jgi:hypothetical protein
MASFRQEGFRIVGIEAVPRGGLLRDFLAQESHFQKVFQTANTVVRAARLALDHQLVTASIPDPKSRVLALVFYVSQHFLHEKRRSIRGDPQVAVFEEYGFPPDLQDTADKAANELTATTPWRTFLDVASAYRAKIFEQQEIDRQRIEEERRQQRVLEMQTRLELARQQEYDELRLRNSTARPQSLVFPEANLDQRERRIQLIALRRTPQGINMTTQEVAQTLHVSVPTITLDQRAVDQKYPGAIPPRHHEPGSRPRQLTVTHRDAIIETVARLEEEHGPWKYRCVTYEMVGDELGMSAVAVKNIVLGDLNLPHQDRGTIHTAIIHDIQALRNDGKTDREIIDRFRGYGVSERQVRMAMGEKL